MKQTTSQSISETAKFLSALFYIEPNNSQIKSLLHFFQQLDW